MLVRPSGRSTERPSGWRSKRSSDCSPKRPNSQTTERPSTEGDERLSGPAVEPLNSTEQTVEFASVSHALMEPRNFRHELHYSLKISGRTARTRETGGEPERGTEQQKRTKSPKVELRQFWATPSGCYRSHFGSRYNSGCCGHAGLFSKRTCSILPGVGGLDTMGQIALGVGN